MPFDDGERVGVTNAPFGEMVVVGAMGVTVGKGVWAFPTFDWGKGVPGVGERPGADERDGKSVGLVLPWHSEAVTVTVETMRKVTVLTPKAFGVVTGASVPSVCVGTAEPGVNCRRYIWLYPVEGAYSIVDAMSDIAL